MAEDARLAGKNAIVTGAASGIGAAVVGLFARLGANVVATDIQDPTETSLGILEDHPTTVRFRKLDVRETGDWSAAIEACKEFFGSPNVLVNNAGALGSGAPVHEETLEGMRAAFEVNTLGMFLGMKMVIPEMLAAGGGGSIINVSSVWGLSAVANNAAYQTAKGAALMLSKNAGVTYAPLGIRVNVVLPGYIDTPMSRGVTAEEAKTLVDFTPLGRHGEPFEMAGIFAFLASEEASFAAAGVFTVDGGMSAL